jgi:uncharacterized 2Fe-2S/4Fe-4S cluster protein (DUF4445 family)
MTKITLKVKADKKILRVKANRGELLSEALLTNGIPVRLYCLGRGVCGQCFVSIVAGQLPEETQSEKELRKRKKLPANYRLACQLRISGPLVVELPPGVLLSKELFRQPERGQQKLTSFVDFNPLVKKYVINLSDLTGKRIEKIDKRIEEKIKAMLHLKQLAFNRLALKKLAVIRKKTNIVSALVYDDKSVLDFEAHDTVSSTFGLAVDLGTTTVAAQLVNLTTGEILASRSAANLQVAFGSDLISRISYASASTENLKHLQKAALDSVNRLAGQLLSETKVQKSKIYAVSLAGNTVMNHLFLGASVKSLGHSPFQPQFIFHAPLMAPEAGLSLNPRAMVYFCPNLASFVGGDVAAGLLYTGLIDKPGRYLFLDLGTNGEIVLKNRKKILATSAAAGPAFEGAGISCGLQAIPGAIEEVKWQGGKFKYSTIGKTKAIGVCGSGLVGILAESIKAGLLDQSGKIMKTESEIKITSKISLTQEDVRKLQLAMAAIKTGIKILLKTAGLRWSDLDGLYLAGAFGNSLNLRQCVSLGLLPPLPLTRIFFVGNASLAGATLVLLSREAREKMKKLPEKVEFASLAERQDFQTEFLKALALGSGYWKEIKE